MKSKYIISILTFIVLGLSGCTNDKNPNIVSEISSSVSTESQDDSTEDADKSSASVRIWDEYTKRYGNEVQNGGLPIEPDLYHLYVEGMKNKSANVRWYCVNKAVEYSNHEKKQEIIDAVSQLLNDPDENVKKAAEFTCSVLKFTFEGEDFIKSPNGKNVAFYNYREARFNDGKLWVYNGEYKEVWLLKTLEGSLGSINWSPSGEKIAVSYGGRLWSDVAIIDNPSGETYGNGLFQHILKFKDKYGYKIGKNNRVDPWITFLEWSPDSNKILLFYSFFDDDTVSQKGAAVYNLQKRDFDKLIPLGPSEADYPKAVKPKDFKW
ncbi:MAG: sister chromatid cohesion protein PDS5 [Clostridia bacterium]|nr:sister chromatid cohesion protein PDS5 [Clostridia bacterium]